MPEQKKTERTSAVERMKQSLRSLATGTRDTLKAHPEILTAPAGALAGGYVASKAMGNPLATATGAAAGGGLAYALTDILKRDTPGVLSTDLRPETGTGPVDTFAASPVTTTANAAVSVIPDAARWTAQGALITSPLGYTLYRLQDMAKRLGGIKPDAPVKPKGMAGYAGGFVLGNPAVWNPIQEAAVNKPLAKLDAPVSRIGSDMIRKALQTVIRIGKTVP